MATKIIFFTGGVVSSVGKGVTAASVGRLLKARGFEVTIQKLDPYLNVDPGTLSPYQHGEVFVLDDGSETDLDLGHYERFCDLHLKKTSTVTTGQVYEEVINRERRGDYLGGTIQVIPHITNEIKRRIDMLTRSAEADIALIEVGGTVGDIEGQPFFSGALMRRWASRSCFGEASAGAPISRSTACWFIGNSATSRRLVAPASSMMIRSTPAAMPPWGGAPYWKARYMPPKRSITVSSP